MTEEARPSPPCAFGPALLIAMVWALLVTSAPAHAQAPSEDPVAFDIPAGRLSSSVRSLARQAGISVASRDSGIRRIQARSVRGALTPAEALRRLLRGTPYQAVSIDGGFRIEKRASPASAAKVSMTTAAQPKPSPPPTPPQPIIVEGTKRAFGASDYPGGVKVIQLDDPVARSAGESLDDALFDVPSVGGTALGSGRNKIFLRGIADSSFNGPTQSTIGLYLGEQRLTFSAPNPDLRLYDVETIELLEGPQGTLYGAGTIAGLLRVNPRAPDPSRVASEGWMAGGFTREGGFNWDAGAVANLPVADEAAVRIVGYGGEHSGYIDDPTLLREEDINSGSHYGGRAAVGVGVGRDWDVSFTVFGQHTEADDGQYIDGAFEGLERSERVAQPFRGRVYGGSVTARGVIGTLEVTSITGLVDNALRSVFDSSVLLNVGLSDPAPGSGPPRRPGGGGGGGGGGGETSSPPPEGERRAPRRQAFVEDREIRLISHETRVSGGDLDKASWLVGVSALRNRDRLRQIFVNLDPDSPDAPPFANQSYQLDELSVFGEGSYRIAKQWTLTGGARLLYTNASGERSFGADTLIELAEDPVRLLPALALSWKPDGVWMAYVRAQQGFRSGGVTIERDPDNNPQTAIFDPDKVRSYETGVRAAWGGRAPIDV
ncbi:MAG: TonB-dependent receptor, partial [Pseudomonadota bacterium]